MNTRFFLREQKGNIYIHADITGNGLRLKTSTGIQIENKKEWNQNPKKQEVRGTDLNSIACNQKLRDIENTVDKLTITHSLSGEKLTSEILKIELLKIIAPHRLKEPVIKNGFSNLLHLTEDFVAKKPLGTLLKKNTYRNRKTFLNLLIKYSDKYGVGSLDFENIDLSFQDNYKKFLFAKNFSISTVGVLTSTLKIMMRYATDRGYNTNTIFEKFKKGKEVEVDTIALTEEEVNAIYNLKLSAPLSEVRDLFVFSCLTGLRYSDAILMSEEKRYGNEIKIKTQKTQTPITIPLRAKAIEILDRNNNRFTQKDNSRFNKDIKEVAKLVPALKQTIEIHPTKGGVRKDKTVKKYEIIGSHTGRRTFCSLAVLKGVPIPLIMRISGHRTISAFQKYVRIEAQTSSDLMKNEFNKMDAVA